MGQLLLIPDPRPLDERLGRAFFREAPRRPGVYLMRDAADRVLYVGKANNLQQRLRNYRIANPDRMPRRHLRMLREVEKIEFQFCPSESAALEKESKLLRTLKPRFNRAGVWPRKTRFFVWRRAGDQLEMAITDVPETGWQRHGPMGSGANYLHGTLARLFWLAINPARAYTELPAGWGRGKAEEKVTIDCGNAAEEIAGALAAFFWDAPDSLVTWLEPKFAGRMHPFERNAIEGELETLREFCVKQQRKANDRLQLALM
jgi:predicted GIY-YIG superfamily endonuclease